VTLRTLEGARDSRCSASVSARGLGNTALVVEDLCEKLLLLSMKVKGVDRIPIVWFWPEGGHSCVAMTHDLETEKGKTFCSELMDIDDSFSIKASIQVVPEERYNVSAIYSKHSRPGVRGKHSGPQSRWPSLSQSGRIPAPCSEN